MAETKKDNRDMRVLDTSELAQFGFGPTDFVVPPSSDMGRQYRPGGPPVPGTIDTKALAVVSHARRVGGVPLPRLVPRAAVAPVSAPPAPPTPPVPPAQPVGKKTGKKGAAVAPVILAPAVYPTYTPPAKQTVVFNAPFGKIRALVSAVLTDEVGVVLVFASDEDVRFVPEQGSIVSVTLPDGAKAELFYTGCLLRYHNSPEQLMVFIRN